MFHSCFTTQFGRLRLCIPVHRITFRKCECRRRLSRRICRPTLNVNPNHLQAIKMGATAVDDWRSENPADRLDLSGANLAGMNFTGWNLSRAILDNADLSGACLRGADLSEAWARRTNFNGADLSKASLYRTSLASSDLRGADLSNTNMYRCVLRDAELNDGTSFDGAWTAKVIWPDTHRQK